MKPDSTLSIIDLYGQPILAGSQNGQGFLAELINASQGLSPSAVVALDFSKVELVSASFFRAAFRAYRDFAISTAGLYPVFVNVNKETLDEARFFAEGERDAFVFASMSKNQELRAPVVIGTLDEKQALTLEALIDEGEADAGQLCRAYPETPKKTPAVWSNRLAALAGKGLIRERIEGRLKKFKPIIEGLNYGR